MMEGVELGVTHCLRAQDRWEGAGGIEAIGGIEGSGFDDLDRLAASKGRDGRRVHGGLEG
jgi:hypothetical protein